MKMGAMNKRLDGKHILLGITGSIAAYKAVDVLRRLQKEGAEVRVVMTEATQKFIAPLTFETLTGAEVVTTMFPAQRTIRTRHVKWAEWADCLLICPATANLVGKIASGIADDFLSTIVMASRAPVIIAPAMDYEMVQNRIYLDNCKKLTDYGYIFVDTQEGELASGAVGPGRLAEPPAILDSVYGAILGNETWKGKKVLVSAGPTREALDPVRYLTNHSSGKMGFAMAEAAFLRGAEVTLVSGPTDLRVRKEIERIDVVTASEMTDAILSRWPEQDILIMSAAVSDFAPIETSGQKIKKGDTLQIALKKTTDILGALAEHPHQGIKVGFALETENGEANALEKLKSKKLDLICLNQPDGKTTGFGTETNQITLLDKTGSRNVLPLMTKWAAAEAILDHIDSWVCQKK